MEVSTGRQTASASMSRSALCSTPLAPPAARAASGELTRRVFTMLYLLLRVHSTGAFASAGVEKQGSNQDKSHDSHSASVPRFVW